MLHTISLSSSYVNIKLTENSKNVPRYVRNIKKTGGNLKFLGKQFVYKSVLLLQKPSGRARNRPNKFLSLHVTLIPYLRHQLRQGWQITSYRQNQDEL